MKATVYRPDGTIIQFEGTPEEYRAAFEFVWPTLSVVPNPIEPLVYTRPFPWLPNVICGPGQVLGKDSTNITATL